MAICGHCGYEAQAFRVCPLCGTAAGETSDASLAPEEPAARGERPAGPPPAWENPSAGFPRNFLDTWMASVFSPTSFFRGVPFEAAAARPILYYLLVTIIAAVINLWWSAIFTAIGLPAWGGSELGLALSPAANATLGFFTAPFAALIGLVFWACVLHVVSIPFAPRRGGFRATVRAICYGSGPSLFGLVPILGGLVGFVWMLVLTAIGLREAHGMSTGAAAAVMVIGVALPAVFLFALLVAIYASLASIA